ncbi:MAG: hypothetical protein WD046_11245 [Paracoccaceae bacterium]
MRLSFATLLLVAACARAGFGPATPDDRITLSLSGSTTGGYSLIVTPDDRVVYDAYANRAAPHLPGWRWGDAQQVSGQAEAISSGAFSRAMALLAAAQTAQSCPPAPAVNRGSIRLTRGAETLYQQLTPQAEQPECHAHFQTLNTALRAAILPEGWVQNMP